jgi:hypothetical protein
MTSSPAGAVGEDLPAPVILELLVPLRHRGGEGAPDVPLSLLQARLTVFWSQSLSSHCHRGARPSTGVDSEFAEIFF